MRVAKTYICGITYEKEREGIEENILPLAKYVDGLNFVIHMDDPMVSYSEAVFFHTMNAYVGCGKIHMLEWIRRYDFSRNRYLLDPIMQDGDFFLVLDSLEKLSLEFCENKLDDLKKLMIDHNLDAIYLSGKLFMARKNENMIYQGAVHEQLHGVQRAVELTQIEGFEDKDSYWDNTRLKVRGDSYWARHMVNYYLISPIQCQMGAEGNPELYRKRVELRSEFKKYCANNNIEWSVDGLLEAWRGEYLYEHMREFINSEKLLNTLYNEKILEKECDHEHNGEIIKVNAKISN